MEPKETLYSYNTVPLFVDAAPSELFINDVDGKIVFTLSLFFPFDRRIPILGQLKEVRKKRRVAKVEIFINLIESRKINFNTTSVVVDKRLALLIAKDFLKRNKLFTLDIQLDSIVNFFGEEITYGKLLCLVWYTFCLYCYCTFAIKVAGAIHYPQVFALLDLLPGDNFERQRNLNIINLIATNSELTPLNHQILQKNNVARFGYGYARVMQYFKEDDMKHSHEFCMTDWICHTVQNNFTKTPDPTFNTFYKYLIDSKKLTVMQNSDFVNFRNSSILKPY